MRAIRKRNAHDSKSRAPSVTAATKRAWLLWVWRLPGQAELTTVGGKLVWLHMAKSWAAHRNRDIAQANAIDNLSAGHCFSISIVSTHNLSCFQDRIY